MALAVEWLPEEWPEGIPNLKQLLVVAPLTTSILLLFGCRNRNLRIVWPILGRVAAPRSVKPAAFVWPPTLHTVICGFCIPDAVTGSNRPGRLFLSHSPPILLPPPT